MRKIGESTTIAQAIERCKAARSVSDAVPPAAGEEDIPGRRRGKEEVEALYQLSIMHCASDAEFVEKLRYLAALMEGEFSSVAIAVGLHFNNPDYFDFIPDRSA